jgi:hypothetical protein
MSATEKEVYSTQRNVQLLQFNPESFGGIRPDMNLVFYFGDVSVVGFTGDQGQGKTSLLNCLIASLGGEEANNSIHESVEDGKVVKSRKSTLTFKETGNDLVTYVVTMTKTAITLKRIDTTSGTPVSSVIESPKTFLRNIFGPVGITPMILKEKDGKKQIEWIRSLYKFTPEQLAQEKELKKTILTNYTKRTDVNKDVKRLNAELKQDIYFSWDDENKTFVPSAQLKADQLFIEKNNLSEEELRGQSIEINERMRQLTQARTRVEQLQTEERVCEERIASLEEKIKYEKALLFSTKEKISTGNEYIKNLEPVEVESEQIQEKLIEIGKVSLKKNNIYISNRKLNEFNQIVDQQIELNAIIDSARSQLISFVKEFTPEIEGLEIIITDSAIDVQKEEGLYYMGRTMAQLSESELWDFYLQICKYFDIRFMFIENVQSLGSAAIERLNWFVENNYGYVFYTAMVRGLSEMTLKLNFIN